MHTKCSKFVLLTAVCCLAFAGCEQIDVGTNSEPVTVIGKMSGEGQPLSNVVLNFQPVAGGLPGVVPVTEGKFVTKLTPGKYAYFLTPSSSAKTEVSIPEKLRQASLDRQIEVSAATLSLEIPVN